jgi:hypothetical protein
MEAYAQQLRLTHGVLSFDIVPDTARCCHSVVRQKSDHSLRRQRPALSRWDSAPPMLSISSDRGNGSSPFEASRKVMRKSNSARDFLPCLPSRSTDVVALPLLLQTSRETQQRRLPAPQKLGSDRNEKVLDALPISPIKLLAAQRDLLPRRPHRQSIDSVVSPSNRSKQIAQLRSA